MPPRFTDAVTGKTAIHEPLRCNLHDRAPERHCGLQEVGRVASAAAAEMLRGTDRAQTSGGGAHGPSVRHGDDRLLRRQHRVRARVRPAVSDAMTFEYAAGLVLSVLLTVYLAYALVRPERF